MLKSINDWRRLIMNEYLLHEETIREIDNHLRSKLQHADQKEAEKYYSMWREWGTLLNNLESSGNDKKIPLHHL